MAAKNNQQLEWKPKRAMADSLVRMNIMNTCSLIVTDYGEACCSQCGEYQTDCFECVENGVRRHLCADCYDELRDVFEEWMADRVAMVLSILERQRSGREFWDIPLKPRLTRPTKVEKLVIYPT